MTALVKTDVAIVGGGIVGASAALALRRLGHEVTVLERDLCGSRSSGVNFGGVRRQGRLPIQLPLAQRAHQIWARLPELIGTQGEYRRTGHFKMARSQEDMAALEAYAQLSRDFDLGLQLFSQAQVRERCGAWVGTAVTGGSLCPEDGQANPRVVSPAFARAAAHAGARVLEHCAVQDVHHDGTLFHLRTTTGLALQAPVLLNCAGAWAGTLAARFDEPVPLYSNHPAMAVTEPLPQVLPWSLGVEGGGIYCRQAATGQLVMGGGQALPVSEDALLTRVAAPVLVTLMQQAVDLLPALRHAHVIRTWSGTEGNLPDRQPVLGPSRTTPGLFHGFGFSGAGFQIGPAAGEVLAELVHHGRSSTPIEPFAIHRFLPSPPHVAGEPR